MTESTTAEASHRATTDQKSGTLRSSPALPTTISTINFKGGVGKTTSCLNLAAAAYEKGLSALVLDLDPQGSATEFAGLSRRQGGPSLYDWLVRGAGLGEVAVNIRPDGGVSDGSIFLCPADERLTKVQNLLYSKGNRSYLKEALARESVRDSEDVSDEEGTHGNLGEASRPEGVPSSFLSRFDFVFVDVPPSVSALSDNVVLASDLVLLVLSCQFMSLNGLRRFTEMLRRAQRAGADPEWFILPTFYRPTEIESSLVWSRVAEAAGTYPEGRLLSPIGRFAAFGQAFQTGQSIFEYDAAHPGAEQFATVFTEIQKAAGSSGTLPIRHAPIKRAWSTDASSEKDEPTPA